MAHVLRTRTHVSTHLIPCSFLTCSALVCGSRPSRFRLQGGRRRVKEDALNVGCSLLLEVVESVAMSPSGLLYVLVLRLRVREKQLKTSPAPSFQPYHDFFQSSCCLIYLTHTTAPPTSYWSRAARLRRSVVCLYRQSESLMSPPS